MSWLDADEPYVRDDEAREIEEMERTPFAQLEINDRYPPASCDGVLVQTESQVQRRRRPCS